MVVEEKEAEVAKQEEEKEEKEELKRLEKEEPEKMQQTRKKRKKRKQQLKHSDWIKSGELVLNRTKRLLSQDRHENAGSHEISDAGDNEVDEKVLRGRKMCHQVAQQN